MTWTDVKTLMTFKRLLRYLLALSFIAAGANHFFNRAFYMNIMPGYLPAPLLLVYISGLFEMLFGLLLLVPRWSVLAGWGLVLLLIAVFPANIHMAMHPGQYPDMSPLALWLRLPLQGVLIAWAYWYTRPSAAAGTKPT